LSAIKVISPTLRIPLFSGKASALVDSAPNQAQIAGKYPASSLRLLIKPVFAKCHELANTQCERMSEVHAIIMNNVLNIRRSILSLKLVNN
jgi:hypothetical protein